MPSPAINQHRAFTLVELLVVIVIIAVLAGLLFPVFGKVRRNGVETRTVSNLRQVGIAMGAYCAEHDGVFPGPLTQEQYPTYGTDAARDAGSLLKRLATYLSAVEKKDASKDTAKDTDVLACPGFTGQKVDEVPGYLMNMEMIGAFKQPVWGVIGSDEKLPLKRTALDAWTRPANAQPDDPSYNPGSDGTAILSRKWAMRHTDQKDAGKLTPPLDGDWVKKLPELPAFDDHYQALFFDLHVERYVPDYTATNP